MLLAIYLNDHLAGSTVGRELARRAASNNRSTGYGPTLIELAQEIDEDRQSLLRIMEALGVRVDPFKVAAGWSAEKLGRLKLNGRLRGYSPLSRVMELEVLILGVQGKLAMWRALDELTPPPPALAGADLGTLQRRAESQLDRLEDCRRRAAAEAFGTAQDAGPQG